MKPIYFKDFKSFLSSTGSIEEHATMIKATLISKEAEEFNEYMEAIYNIMEGLDYGYLQRQWR